ncbi:primosomal protein N' [Ruficoccus amylovorans]|uniref:Replication restart protein PriA n=1 Tax=Ruficoccus amylovorans TaxID=1804625 RepID=A0A842HF39_9BACT|nr:primosomal protein N' [Ruficoccus amylovorans]MBC2594246.1 primosomal protein N' [Ruficoccus amylovorans]
MPEASAHIIEVLPIGGPEKPLAYAVPARLKGCTAPGALVRVPLLNRSRLGLVCEGLSEEIDPARLKFVHDALYDEPVVSPDLLKLALWLSRYYAASLESVLETIVPAPVRAIMAPRTTRLLALAHTPTPEEMDALVRRAPRQADLVRFLEQQQGPVPRSLLMSRLKLSSPSCDALVKKGLLKEVVQEDAREVYTDDLGEEEALPTKEVTLTEEQAAALADIELSLDANEFRPHLIHGVTGSGKTEIYLRALERVVDEGGSVIFLVPEVALTPQTVGRLRSRLSKRGERVVVWHSHLSAGERADGWMAMARGEARVVVGARSAIFAPLKNLKLIIVDEEHEPAYKQAESPRYHGRDVAVYRSMLCGAVCLLGSATPALESLYNVETKSYRLNRLSKRVDDRQLPSVHIVDMKRERLSPQGAATISSILADKLLERFEKQEQSILFLNRRGYSTRMICPDCSYVAECPHCSVTLTYHRTDNRLKCHICGYQERPTKGCPKCGSAKYRGIGFGTQRIEETVQKIVPRARIMRLDTDTMSKKHLFRKILSDFRTGKLDILVGTQMLAKGLDFPNVTLVGMVDADIALHVPDFRAAERTFQLLVQVAGRAGRGDKAGEVVVQTFMPHSPPIQYARRADFEGFLQEELEQRREFHYPPFRHLVRHLFRGRNPEKVAFFAEQWSRQLEERLEKLGHNVEIRGPVAAPLEKIKDTYRFHLWYFVGNVSRILPDIVALRKDFPMDEDVVDVLDVDPVDLV